MSILLLSILACGDRSAGTGDSAPALQAEDCVESYGDNCSCTPQCLSPEQVAAVQEHFTCDLGCDPGGTAEWACTVEDGACVVVDP